MVDQLPLLFELRDEFSLDAYVRDGNEALCTLILELPSAPEAQMLWLHAAPGTGKTHLAQALVAELAARGERVAYLPAQRAAALAALEGLQQFQLVVIDDADHWLNNAATEQALVGLYQELRAGGGHLLLFAAQPPLGYEFALPDWRSRCQGAGVFALAELSDSSKIHVLRARAERLGLTLDDRVGSYLLRHGPRALPDLLHILVRLDRAALAEQRQLSVPFTKRVLGL